MFLLQGTTLDAVLQAKATISDVVAAQASHGPCQTLAQIQARNADNKALMDLSRALGKKVFTHSCSTELRFAILFTFKVQFINLFYWAFIKT